MLAEPMESGTDVAACLKLEPELAQAAASTVHECVAFPVPGPRLPAPLANADLFHSSVCVEPLGAPTLLSDSLATVKSPLLLVTVTEEVVVVPVANVPLLKGVT